MKNIYIILVTTVTDSTPQDGQYGDAVQYKNHLFVFLFILFISNTGFTISLMPWRDFYSCKLKHCEFILFVETFLMESSSLALVKIREQRVLYLQERNFRYLYLLHGFWKLKLSFMLFSEIRLVVFKKTSLYI